jgi:S-adenosylmethionine-diacylglycerol 3-amino-3-carboxypropyl transferase
MKSLVGPDTNKDSRGFAMGGAIEAHVQGEGELNGRRNHRLAEAVHRYGAASRKGLEERFFTWAFSGLVYPQIWEDPVVDLDAMALKPGEWVAAIASGGCNVLSYVTAKDVRVTALDLNPAHVALNKLKLAAVRHSPDYETFARFFVSAADPETTAIYDRLFAPHLDRATRGYWEGRDALGRRRISYFSRSFYRQGLLGWFITAGHVLARMHGRNPAKLLDAKSRADQQRLFNEELAPLFAMRHMRWLMDKPASLFGLGIPPSQFDALKGDAPHMADVLKERLGRLAYGFDLNDNYFAWQAFGRGYAAKGDGPLPLYLDRANWETLKGRSGNVDVVHASFSEHLASFERPAYDAYVLLDAQDWMTDEQLTKLWSEIVRTGKPGCRVIFRTAGEETILPGRVPSAILGRFRYHAEQSRALSAKDRSSIYGGFHLYTLEA